MLRSVFAVTFSVKSLVKVSMVEPESDVKRLIREKDHAEDVVDPVMKLWLHFVPVTVFVANPVVGIAWRV
jgi:hypothetical protein